MKTTKTARRMGTGPARQAGVAMIELLLAVFILLIGLLGLAALQLKVANANVDAYQRTQATVLLADMVERFYANRLLQSCLAFTNATSGLPYVGQAASASDANLLNVGSGSSVSCTATGTSADANALVELAAWDAELKGSTESLAGSTVGAFQGAKGCVSQAAATDGSGMTVYTIAVAWQGSEPGVAPSNPCGAGAFGSDDTFRRVVWTTVRAANMN